MTSQVDYADCSEEFLRRQALYSELFKHSLTLPAQQRIDTARNILPAIEKLNDRIRQKLAHGVGEVEAERIARILRTEGVLLQHLLNIIHMPQKHEGMPLFKKVGKDLKDNAGELKNYPELAQALLDYDTALYKQIDDILEGVDYASATTKANGYALKLASAANKLTGKKSMLNHTPILGTASPLIQPTNVTTGSTYANTYNSYANTNAFPNKNAGWVVSNNVNNVPISSAVLPVSSNTPVVIKPAKKKGLSWEKMLWWLALAAIVLGLGYYLFKNKKETGSYFGSSSTMEAPDTLEGDLGDTGFTGLFGPSKSSNITSNIQAGDLGIIDPRGKAALLDAEGDLRTGFLPPRSSPLIDYGRF